MDDKEELINLLNNKFNSYEKQLISLKNNIDILNNNIIINNNIY